MFITALRDGASACVGAANRSMDGAAVTRLEVVHRSTGAIMRVADSVIDERDSGRVSGPAPTLTFANTRSGMVEQTAELLRAAHAVDRTAHICVVCRSKADAETLHRELSHWLDDLGAPVRLGHNKQFVFAPGITVSNSRQVKGLEFDTVIVFDPSGPSENVRQLHGTDVVTRFARNVAASASSQDPSVG